MSAQLTLCYLKPFVKQSIAFPCFKNITTPLVKEMQENKKRGLKLVCNVNIVYGKLKSENSQDYAASIGTEV